MTQAPCDVVDRCSDMADLAGIDSGRMPLTHHAVNACDPAHPALVAGNKVELLIDGPATYDAIFDAIDAATHHIHLEFYIYKNVGDGEVGICCMPKSR